MMSNKSNPKPLICPYNPAHTMLRDRVQKHLVKCRRNYPDAKKVSCIYNVTHQIPEPELSYHLEECSDRLGLDKHTFVPETAMDKYPIPQSTIQQAEIWDDDDVPAYNPEEHCKNNPILRNAAIFTQPAAVRKNFRMEERQRMQQFDVTEKSTPVEPAKPSHPRRPVTESAGVKNRIDLDENAPLDVAELLAKVKLQSKVVVQPTLAVSPNGEDYASGASTSRITTEEEFPQLPSAKESFPPLGGPRMNRLPTQFSNAVTRGRARSYKE